MSAGRRPVARGNTASGFPVRGVSVKTSTRQKSKNRSAIALGLGARMGVGVLNPRPTGFCAPRPSADEGDDAIAAIETKARDDLAIRDRRGAGRAPQVPQSLLRPVTRDPALH